MCGRDEILRDIRRDALIVKVPLDGKDVFLTVSKHKDNFNPVTGKDGVWATSVSEAALHLYNSVGPRWKQHVSMTRQARQRDRTKKKAFDDAGAKRDEAWPFSEPDRNKLLHLHEHRLNGDRFIKPKKI